MLASVQNSDVPPCEISGSGIPLVGTSDSTTLILKNACSRIVSRDAERHQPRERIAAPKRRAQPAHAKHDETATR